MKTRAEFMKQLAAERLEILAQFKKDHESMSHPAIENYVKLNEKVFTELLTNSDFCHVIYAHKEQAIKAKAEYQSWLAAKKLESEKEAIRLMRKGAKAEAKAKANKNK